MNLVNNKIVDIESLRISLENKFQNYTFFESKKELSDHVDIFVQDNVELLAFHEAVEELGESATNDIYETINNVDEFRDCVNDFINQKYESIRN